MKFKKKFNPWFFFSILITFLLSLPIISILINVLINYNIEWNEVINNEINDYLINTSFIIFFQTILVIIFGVLSAWIVTIYNISFRRLIDFLLLLPLCIPPYIAAIAYGEIYDFFNYSLITLREGDNFFSNLFLPNIRSLPGVVFIVEFQYFLAACGVLTSQIFASYLVN